MKGVSVKRFPPFWHVVERDDGRFVVVDTSGKPLPVKVFGPASRPRCEEWARVTAGLFLSVTGNNLELRDWMEGSAD